MSRNSAIGDPAPGGTALLIIDMINHLDFSGGDLLQPMAQEAAGAIGALRSAADAAGVPVVYVNDNFNQWHSEPSRLIEFARDNERRGALFADLLPRENDFFVIKPQFSGFYATSLPVLLPRLKVSRLILTGVAADICVLFTAADAHMREYGLWVPADAVASESRQRTDWALDIMGGTMGAETRSTADLPLRDWIAGGTAQRPSAGVEQRQRS